MGVGVRKGDSECCDEDAPPFRAAAVGAKRRLVSDAGDSMLDEPPKSSLRCAAAFSALISSK